MPAITKSKMGAKVQYCGHNGTFPADIFVHGETALVVAPGSINLDRISRPATGATHHMVDYPTALYWNPGRGYFMVPRNQVQVLENKE